MRREKKLGQREGKKWRGPSEKHPRIPTVTSGLRAHSLAPEPRLWTPLQEH